MLRKIPYLLLLTFLIFPTAHAFKMSPIEVFVNSSGPGKTRTITLTNNEKIEIPVEVKIYSRSMELDGKETRKPTLDLIVFPTQLILKPGEKRNLRVTWNGEPDLSFEKSYRIHVRQIPVDVKKKNSQHKDAKSNLNIIFSYMGSLYVQPEKTKIEPKLVVSQITPLKNDHVKIRLENQGSEHAILKNFDIFIRGKNIIGDKRLERQLDEKFISQENLTINMLAKSARDITYKLPPKTVTNSPTFVFKRKIK